MTSPSSTPPPPEQLTAELLAEYGWIRRLARRLLGADPAAEVNADDVAQTVVAAALEQKPEVRERDGIRSWLERVTRRQASLGRRRHRRRAELEKQSARPADASGADDPAAVVARLHLHRRLTELVLALPEPYRSVVVARFLEERSVSEIASARGVTNDAVRQQLSRGVRMLRARLVGERGADWRAGLALLCGPGPAFPTTDLGQPAPPPVDAASPPPITPALLAATSIMKTALGVVCVSLVLLALVWALGAEPHTDPGTALTRAQPAADSAAPEGESSTTGAGTDEVARTPVAPARGEPETLRLHVRDAFGGAIPEATVALVPDARPLDLDEVRLLTTGVDGTADLGPVDRSRERTWHLLVAAEGRLPSWAPFEVPAAQDAVVFTLGGRGRISGVVRTAGDPAALAAQRNALPEQLLLRGGGSNPLFSLPDNLRRRLRELGLVWLNKATARVDPRDGRFAFLGLPDEPAEVAVEMPWEAPFVVHGAQTTAVRTTRQSAWFAVGSAGVVLAVVPVPAIRGRVVFEDGQPAAAATLRVRAWLVEDDGPGMFVLTAPDGRFCVPLDLESIPDHRWLDAGEQPRVVRVDFHEVSHREAAPRGEFTYDFPPRTRWGDVGDIVLRRLDALHVLARDRSGAPVLGAVVAGAGRSSPTGTDGRTIVAVADLARRAFRIGAPGCLVDEYEATGGSGTADDPLVFTLAPANRVTLRFASEHVRPGEVLLEIVGPKELFHAQGQRSPILPSSLHRCSGTSRFSSGGNRKGRTTSKRNASLEPDGTFRLSSLIPGQDLEIAVVDRGGAVLVETSATTPPFGESVELDLVPAVPICRIEGRVVSSTGEAVAGAEVRIGVERRREGTIHQGRAYTDTGGGFALPLQATSDSAPVRIEARGHRVYAGTVGLAEGLVEPVFVLEPGRDVVVRVVDASGAPVEAEVEVADAEVGAETTRLEDGSTRCSRLPGRPVELTAWFAGRVFTKTVDPLAQETVTIEVPRPIAIPLRVATDVSAETVLVLHVEATSHRGRIYRQVHCVDGAWQPSTLEIYPGEYAVRCGVYAASRTWTASWHIEPDEADERWLMR